jgi:hypothetical protein
MRNVVATSSLTLDGVMQAPAQHARHRLLGGVQGNGVRLHNGEFQDQDED